MKKRFSEEQIIGFLREADAGLPTKELCRKHGFSEASYYGWKTKFGGMTVSEAENAILKRLLASSILEIDAMKVVSGGRRAGEAESACDCCKGEILVERQPPRLVGMSASVLRYQPRDDGNDALRTRLKELAG